MHDDVSKLRVLIVDKQPAMRTLLRQVLRAFGVGEIHDALSVEAGWEEFNALKPDLTLIDWGPDFDGLALLRMIRTDAGSCFQQAPVIMVSAFGETQRVYQALDAGMTEYLVKPASARQIHARFVAAIGRARPFIRASGFAGPCRRRRNQEFDGPDHRGSANADAGSANARESASASWAA